MLRKPIRLIQTKPTELKPATFVDKILDKITEVKKSKQDRYHDAIVAAFESHFATTDKPAKFKDIYYLVCLNLGATAEEASKGIAICPYEDVKKDIRGLVRSWVEERSPHSRQHYFRGGKRVSWTTEQRPLLFVNWGLAKANTQNEWMPYNRVRGDGWILDPKAAEKWVKPDETILEAAAKAYKKVGMQGCPRTANVQDIVKVTRRLKISKLFT